MEIIQLIKKSEEGDKASLDQLFDLIYQDLKFLSRKIKLNWRNEHTLNTTALVHEAYLKVYNSTSLNAMSKLHFYRICGRAMKFILQDHVKQKNAVKRGDGMHPIELNNEIALNINDETLETMEAIFHNIEKLQSHDPVIYDIIECRFFADMTVKETSDVLSISPATVKRKWSFAKAFISNELRKSA